MPRRTKAPPTATPHTPANRGDTAPPTPAAAPDALPPTRKARQRKGVAVPGAFVPFFWAEQDGRHHVAKEVRRRVEALKADAGVESTQKELVAQRAVFISLQLETMEVTAARTGEFDPGVYTQMVNSLLGLLKSLGLDRKARTVDLRTYVGGRA